MITHADLGYTTFKRSRRLKDLLNKGEVQLAGNSKLKIYGTLSCSSGKRMKTGNRVFFESEAKAKSMGYRPCGHCMREKYLEWKAEPNFLKRSPPWTTVCAHLFLNKCHFDRARAEMSVVRKRNLLHRANSHGKSYKISHYRFEMTWFFI